MTHEQLLKELDLPFDAQHSEPATKCVICVRRIEKGL